MAEERDYNLDPITHEPGAHPVGTGVGTAGGAVAGAAAGSLAGPAGAVVGGVAGAVAGGLAGKAVAEGINPTAEEAYWRETYTHEPYYRADRTYDDYSPAYELGWSAYGAYGGDFEAAQDRLAGDWETRRKTSRLGWAEAMPATRAAWNRVHGLQAAGSMSNDDVVDVLNDLIETCRDGEFGFNACAEHAEGAMLKALFLRRAAECHHAVGELETHVRRLGGEPHKRGTASGAIHRGWVAVRGTLTGYSDQAMLEECERGEDAALARYRKALKQALPSDIRQVVELQSNGVQRNHDQIKALRDQGRVNTKT
jgi:uncharacterized protein (TIGR02284 family)